MADQLLDISLDRSTPREVALSGYLFILALRILLIQIRENADIKDIVIDKTEIKISAHGIFFITVLFITNV